MLILLLLLCCCGIFILGGGYYYYMYDLPEPEPEPEPDEEELKTIHDKAYDREMKKIVGEMKEETRDTVEQTNKVNVARQALDRAKFNTSNVGDAFKTVSESSKKLAEAKAQILVYQGFVNTATYDDEKAIWQEAVDQTQNKINYFQTTYDEAKKAADAAAAALREKAEADRLLAIENARLAEQRRVEAAAAAEAQRKAKELADLKEGCKNVTWENVYVGGRPGADLAFWDKKSIITGGTTITKGNKKITTERPIPKKTTVQENQMSGRDSRGRPTYSWRNKGQYDGYIALKGDKVGWFSMNKKPSSRQPSSCKDSRPYKTNCAYEPGDFNELHNFNDSSKEIKFVIVDNHMGVMQAQTGKFYSIPDKKVMDNPLTSDCKTKLDYK